MTTRSPRVAVLMIAGLATASALVSAPACADPSGFAFLEVPAGARASSMGGAFVAVGDGVEAAFWNPAGLANVGRVQITGSHYEYFQHLRHDQFALAGPWLGGGLSASVRALYSEPIEARDELGNVTGTFGGDDLEFGLAYGRTLAAGVRAGVSAQLLRERLADLSTGTFAFGAGASWEPAGMPALRLGLALDHVGPDANYTFADGPGQPLPLPTAVQAGASYRWGLSGAMHLGTGIETRIARGRPAVAAIGGELTHPSGAALRVGIRINDSTSSISMGVGYALTALRLDYAFVPYRLDLGDSHRISFTARF
jgi:uncharacterized protein UPF0164